MAQTTELPNNCWIGKISVYPKNWKTNAASLKKDWYIFYRFHDPLFQDKYPNGKLCPVANMNDIKSLSKRQQATAYLLKKEIESLEEGYNPITRVYKAEEPEPTVGDIHPGISWPQALMLAFDKLTCCKPMKKDIKSALKYITNAIAGLRLSTLAVGQVGEKHINMLFDHLALHKPKNKYKKVAWSPQMHNKYRAYLMMLFKKIKGYQAIPSNPILSIETKRRQKPIPQVLTDEELIQVSTFLRTEHPRLHTFLGCFYPSGSRETELLNVKGHQVNLKTKYFTRVIKKGGQFKEEPTIITAGAFPYWQEAMQGCGANDYVFARGLKPGPVSIAEGQNPIGRYWNRHVKKKLGITADPYKLKHLFATKSISRTMDDLRQARELAAKHAGHTTTDMMKDVYDVNKRRLDEELLKNEVGF